MDNEFRRLPSVDKIISDKRIKQLEESYPREFITELVRQQLKQERQSISIGKPAHSLDEVINSIHGNLSKLVNISLRPVINATGVVLHTNLGRAPLSKEAIAAMDAVARGYCNLEFELGSGVRGSRHSHIEQIICQLTGAEGALVVNNNASAVLLGLTALAKRKEVIVSRGQAIEIGGSFRIPDVMRQSGAKLVEVGTTNCTYIADYEQAISPRTAVLMRVHSSNFQVTGFTQTVTLEELIELGKKYDLPVFDDLGSGCFLDTTVFGLGEEPMVQKSITAGVGLVSFSGDKLVGGPQAGVIAGKKQYIDKLRKHPLARAARIDKVRLAGMTATLIHYIKGEATEKIPIWQMLSTRVEEIDRRARMWANVLDGLAEVVEGESMVGGGSLPGSTLPTRLVAIEGRVKNKGYNVQTLSRELRNQKVPVIGRISDDVLYLDPRSVLPEDDRTLVDILSNMAASLK
jgi:L-seryl-tRNA(Ser) seleniumtransferase